LSFYLSVTCLKQCWCRNKFYYSILYIYYLLDNSWLSYMCLYHLCKTKGEWGWISWKSMHFSWKDDSPLWILCVSWCQIERAARLRLRLGNLLHLHAIRDSKTWNDLAHVCISWSVHITLCVDIISFLLEFSFKFIWIFQNINNKRFQDFSLK
jgi:hypothetical protein